MAKSNQNQYKILLIKPMKHNTYIRKVKNWAYTEFKALCIVNKENKVTHIAADAIHGVQQATILDNYLKSILGKKRVEKLKPEDMLRFWIVKETIPLTPEYNLDTPVRGLRYATAKEELDIEKTIIKSWFKENNLNHYNVFYNTGEYPKIYGSCISYDFHEALFELEKNGELYEYTGGK